MINKLDLSKSYILKSFSSKKKSIFSLLKYKKINLFKLKKIKCTRKYFCRSKGFTSILRRRFTLIQKVQEK